MTASFKQTQFGGNFPMLDDAVSGKHSPARGNVRALRKRVGAGLLVQVGYGLYARAKRSVLSGKPIPSVPLIEIGYQALRRLGHSPKPSPAALDYIEGRTMQVTA